MRSDFCAFILSHGRPDRVYTHDTLVRSGYTGKVFVVIDDEDKTRSEYIERFGDKVLQFCKSDFDSAIDCGDNFGGRASTIWPRAAFWTLAEKVGCKHFVQLDDDYTNFEYRFDELGNFIHKSVRKTCDQMFDAILEFHIATPTVSVAMSQGGDFIGGSGNVCSLRRLRRKAMNSFFCSTDRPFNLLGRRNEDVSAYVSGSIRGELFFTVMQAMLKQVQTQKNPGVITDSYLESGTYIKSFYTVMYAPSCTKVGLMGDPRGGQTRIHHKINWHNTAPKILREEWRGPRQQQPNNRALLPSLREPCHASESSAALPAPSEKISEPRAKRKGVASKPQS
jgi:hypothetical protein